MQHILISLDTCPVFVLYCTCVMISPLHVKMSVWTMRKAPPPLAPAASTLTVLCADLQARQSVFSSSCHIFRGPKHPCPPCKDMLHARRVGADCMKHNVCDLLSHCSQDHKRIAPLLHTPAPHADSVCCPASQAFLLCVCVCGWVGLNFFANQSVACRRQLGPAPHD